MFFCFLFLFFFFPSPFFPTIASHSFHFLSTTHYFFPPCLALHELLCLTFPALLCPILHSLPRPSFPCPALPCLTLPAAALPRPPHSISFLYTGSNLFIKLAASPDVLSEAIPSHQHAKVFPGSPRLRLRQPRTPIE